MFNINKKDKQPYYIPLANRQAILINVVEEDSIINKIHNQGLKSIKENAYYNDLINYKIYPYNNFKQIQKDGFNYLILKLE